jgi:hypothetical protein
MLPRPFNVDCGIPGFTARLLYGTPNYRVDKTVSLDIILGQIIQFTCVLSHVELPKSSTEYKHTLCLCIVVRIFLIDFSFLFSR